MNRVSKKQTGLSQKHPLNLNLLDRLKTSKGNKYPLSKRDTWQSSDLDKVSTRSISLIADDFSKSPSRRENFDNLFNSDNKPRKPSNFTPNNSYKFKTEICRNFSLTGRCNWGNKCFFAHGKTELKTKMFIGTQYKTKVCKRFHGGKVCLYSSRCQYFHFKGYELYQEMLESTQDKLLVKMAEPGMDLEKAITSSKRTQSRLDVFKRLCSTQEEKSLQQHYNEGNF